MSDPTFKMAAETARQIASAHQIQAWVRRLNEQEWAIDILKADLPLLHGRSYGSPHQADTDGSFGDVDTSFSEDYDAEVRRELFEDISSGQDAYAASSEDGWFYDDEGG